MIRHEPRQCPSCGEINLVAIRRPNHVLHALLSLLTVGLWIVVWLVMMLDSGRAKAQTTCKNCGTKFS